MIDILREMVIAGEAAGWDVNENAALLNRARDALGAVDAATYGVSITIDGKPVPLADVLLGSEG